MAKVKKREFKSTIKKIHKDKSVERNKRIPMNDEKRIHDWKQFLNTDDDEDDLLEG